MIRRSGAGVREAGGRGPGAGRLMLAALLLAPPAAAAQTTHLLVVTGVSGDAAHAQKFHDLATRFIDAARQTQGVADANLTYLAEKVEDDPQRISGRSTRESIEQAFADIAGRAAPDDTIFVLLIGHGSSPDPRSGAFNLPGPDLTSEDYARLLGRWSTQRVVFVNTASASGAFLPAVAGPGRVVVTATRTGRENLETRFPEYFVEAYEAAAADRDRSGRVSVLEAFDYARALVEKAFEQEGHLLTEHATLDDGHEGTLASTVFLASGSAQAAARYDLTDPEAARLLAERDRLEQQVAGLRLRKDGMDPDQYARELEKLLLALAQTSRALQAYEAER
ncbi:MAG: hypothetical protein IT176_12575 [Acidobacteria bacterium]|nr:hypothetical protein [Acidobacteriota bacterium]